jgi:RNA polymerase sigma-70 factor (ECF subfamily)
MPSSTVIDASAHGIAADMSTPEGLEQQFKRLLGENRAALKRLATSYAGPGDSDDLLQEIAIAIWRALAGFRGACSERTFLFRIAHNRCISHLAKKRPMVSLDDLEVEPADPAGNAERLIADAQEQEHLLRAIRSLPMIYREVIVLLLEGLEYREIAEVVGITDSNVGVRLNRARQHLKLLLEEKS